MVDPVLLLTDVAPALGVVTAILLFFSPLAAAHKAVAHGSLGTLNPIPFPLVAANCGGWVAYAITTKDPYVFLANAPGVIVGLYMMMISLRLSDTQTANRIILLVLMSAALLEAVGFLGAMGVLLHNDLKRLWGLVANGILLVFYASPLSSLLKVFQTRSNASIHLTMAVMTILNSALWVVYGLAIKNAYIWVPNSVGGILGLVQVILYIVFSGKKRSDIDEPLLASQSEEP